MKEGQRRLLTGDYASCTSLAGEGIKGPGDTDDWSLLLCQALLASGQYPEARTAITNALAKNRWSLALCWQAREAFLANGQTDRAAELVERILQMVSSQPRDYRDAISLVVFGQAALLKGADPKRVLDSLLDAARKANPELREVHLACGNLALEKHDFALAAKRFEEGLKRLPDDPDLHYGLAQAYGPSDPALTATSLEAALGHNQNHVPSLLLLVDHSIDAESYAEADKFLERIEKVNPWHPDAWAYRAVIAHLRRQPEAEETARQSALKFWPNNPRVDHLIGLKLSQNYRFAEGSAHQRAALKFDPAYLPAKAQLAQDLLRLGEEAEGWQLADEVQKQDGYDIAAYNLANLHDTMTGFTTLTNQDFLLRMGRREATLYGDQVLTLLGQARSNLCSRYGMELKDRTIVEMFPEQKDFAIRTFGMPGNPGYLGVCFGSVITANSPASQRAHPVNWQAMLWHEFCHVVTLQMTRNKMPRWLSEGISVYEETQANGAWGQRMNPRYREMVLKGELTPVSKLSAAFLSPRSAFHLQFAYYESSLVVEFLVGRFGLSSLKAILQDLGEGKGINQAIEARTAPMATFERDFESFARERALQLAPGLDWEKPKLADLPQTDSRGKRRMKLPGAAETNAPTGPDVPLPLFNGEEPDVLVNWAQSHPTNFYALTQHAESLVKQKKYQEAKQPLEHLVELYPGQIGSGCGWSLLAVVHRELGETNAERMALSQWAARDDEALSAYRRSMELAAAAQDWPVVQTNVLRYLAVDPLVPLPYRFLAQAGENLGERSQGIAAYRALLLLDPPDPAEVHFRLAQLLHQSGDPAARRQVLQALEEAPRHRSALRLLLEINGENSDAKPPVPTATAAPAPAKS